MTRPVPGRGRAPKGLSGPKGKDTTRSRPGDGHRPSGRPQGTDHPAAVYRDSLSRGSYWAVHHGLDHHRRPARRRRHRPLDLRLGGAALPPTPPACAPRLVERYAPATVNKMLTVLRGVLKTCWRLGLMDAETYRRAADVANVRAKTLPAGRGVEREEVAALLEACAADPSPAGRRDAALVAILYGAGLRRAELCGLDLADFDDAGCALTVRAGKGRRIARSFSPAVRLPAGAGLGRGSRRGARPAVLSDQRRRAACASPGSAASRSSTSSRSGRSRRASKRPHPARLPAQLHLVAARGRRRRLHRPADRRPCRRGDDGALRPAGRGSAAAGGDAARAARLRGRGSEGEAGSAAQHFHSLSSQGRREGLPPGRPNRPQSTGARGCDARQGQWRSPDHPGCRP